MTYYIYKFINTRNQIIYIGKTNNIERRMSQHFSNGHLKRECYNQVVEIKYAELKSKIEMDIKELYYINKLKPLFNLQNKKDDELDMIIEENENWKSFGKTRKEISIKVNQFVAEKLTAVSAENKQLRKDIKELKRTRYRDMRKFKNCFIEELSERNELVLKVLELNKFIQFYEQKTCDKYKYLYTNE